MKLEEFMEVVALHDAIRDFSHVVLKKAPGYGKGSPYQMVCRLLNSYKRKLKLLADRVELFSGSKNGGVAFDDFTSGFRFAVSLPRDIDVIKYVMFRDARNATFFYKPETLAAVDELWNEVGIQFAETRKLVDVYSVMAS